jgi:hypothetical protein
LKRVAMSRGSLPRCARASRTCTSRSETDERNSRVSQSICRFHDKSEQEGLRVSLTPFSIDFLMGFMELGQKRGRGGSVGGREYAFERSGSQTADCSNMAPHLAPCLSASEPQAGDRILVFRPQWLSLVLSGQKKVEVRGAAYKSGSYYLGHALLLCDSLQ